MKEQVTATETAKSLIRDLKKTHGENLIFHQSGGCCDGSSPMLFVEGTLIIVDVDVKLCEMEVDIIYMNKKQYDYWKHTNLELDVVDGRGSMFSIEGLTGKRFHIRSSVRS